MGFLSELFGKKKEGPSESYYENGDVPREFFSIGTTDTHYLVKEGIPWARVLSPEPGGRGRPRRQRLQGHPVPYRGYKGNRPGHHALLGFRVEGSSEAADLFTWKPPRPSLPRGSPYLLEGG